MARIRSIKPEFWSSQTIAELSVVARLVFIGVISAADDDGRLPGRASAVRSYIFPNDDEIGNDDVDGWLGELERERLIVRYRVGKSQYIAVNGFREHQYIQRYKASVLPPPPDADAHDQTSTVLVTDEYGTRHGRVPSGMEGIGREQSAARASDVDKVVVEIVAPIAPLGQVALANAQRVLMEHGEDVLRRLVAEAQSPTINRPDLWFGKHCRVASDEVVRIVAGVQAYQAERAETAAYIADLQRRSAQMDGFVPDEVTP